MAQSATYAKLFRNALAKGRERDYPGAVELLTRITAESDEFPEAWLYLGRARHAMGESKRAINAYASYLERKPEDGAGWFFLGREYLALGLCKGAAKALQYALANGKDDAEAWAFLGLAELKSRRIRKSVESFERAMGHAPDDPRIFKAYLNALYIQAIRTLSRGEAELASQMLGFIIANGMDGIGPRVYRAKAYREQGRARDALADLTEAMRQAPDDQSLAMQAAVLYFALGEPQTALAILERSGAKLPGGPETQLSEASIERWRAAIAFSAGDYRSALAAALSRIKQGDRDPAIRALAAQANYELGRYEKAAAHYRLAIAADPKSPDLRMGLSLSLWELGEWDEARAAAKAAARCGADPADYLYVETLCDARSGAPPSSLIERTQNLLRVRPGDGRLMFILAEAYYKTGRPDLAGPWFEDIAALDPSHEMALLYLVSVAESGADEGNILAAYARYLERFPDNGSMRKQYVDRLVRARSWEEAAAAIEDGYAYGMRGKGPDRLLAFCYRGAKRWREAAAMYRSLLIDDARNVEYLLGLTHCLERSGAREMAAAVLSRGAAYIAKEAEPYLALGVMLARGGKAESAANAFTKAAELAPADPRPLRNLANLYERGGIREMAERFRERADRLERPNREGKPKKG